MPPLPKLPQNSQDTSELNASQEVSSQSTFQKAVSLSENFNYYITQFFLNNIRLTVLLFILLLIVGGIATFSLRTTGFPNPEIKFAFIQTIYPGASSQTVLEDVTKPLENAIKEVDGIEQTNSNTGNNFSNIVVQIEDEADSDTVRNGIGSAISSVPLPEGVQQPQVSSPEVSGPTLIYSVYSPNISDTYRISQDLINDISSLSDTSSVESLVELQRVIEINVNNEEAEELGIDPSQVEYQIANINVELPVTSDTSLTNNQDSQNFSIITSISGGQSIDEIRNLEFFPTSQSSGNGNQASNQSTQQQNNLTSLPPTQGTNINQTPPTNANQPNQQPQAPSPVRLSEFAQVDFAYKWEDTEPVIGINKDNGIPLRPVIVIARSVDGSDQGAYERTIEDIIDEYENIDLLDGSSISNFDSNKSAIITNYSINIFNERQINEVISGLIGGRLDIVDQVATFFENTFSVDDGTGIGNVVSNIGWILGGIQLVFLVMLAFVSWRAAIIAAVSIPLSLTFTTIYLFFIGESLNTLVLFSLVLVIGLVVDPALVILESIQRKIDTGLKGKDAALAAVKDVGNGLFLATLTNIIVFTPFGVISGLLGEIFSYIPLTIIPATIGSYIVPLIFLAWMGGLILKPGKTSSDDEEKNLWGIAKWFIWINEKILKGKTVMNYVVKPIIIIAGFAIPMAITVYLFSTGELRAAQFATNDNGDFIIVSGSYSPTSTLEEREEALVQTLTLVAEDDDVNQVFPIGEGLQYYAELKPINQRNRKAADIARDLNDKLIERFGDKSANQVFFDISVQVEQNGPPESNYQVAISIENDNLNVLRETALDVTKTLENVCFSPERTVSIDTSCSEGKRIVSKVDNGYTNKENKTIEIILNRNDVLVNRLNPQPNPSNPQSFILSSQINSILQNLFETNEFENSQIQGLSSIEVDGEETQIILAQDIDEPESIEEIRNTVVGQDSQGNDILLSEISEIREITPPNNIQRVEGRTIGVVNARLIPEESDQGVAALVTNAVVEEYSKNNFENSRRLNVDDNSIEVYSEGDSAGFARSFTELLNALVLAIFLSYVVLAVFFRSFLQPIVVLYTIPLTFLGLMPGLAYFTGGEIGFLEIIGIIILVGIVENVAIFLIDTARQKINEDNWEYRRAISYASGVRFRPVLLTTFTAVASLAPLAFLSIFYRSISVTIMFGLISSGFISLITTPILFSFFTWSSKNFHHARWYQKVLSLFVILIPILTTLTVFGFETFDPEIISDSALQVLLGSGFGIGALTTIIMWIYWSVKDKDSRMNLEPAITN